MIPGRGCKTPKPTQQARTARGIVEALKGAGKPPKPRRFDPQDPAYRGPTVERMRRNAISLGELAEFLGVTEDNAALMLASLREAGYIVDQDGGRFRLGRLRPDTSPTMLSYDRLRGDRVRFGVIADPHLASVHERLDVLETAAEEFKRQRIREAFIVGNLLDGYREHINGGEVRQRNCTDQCIYAADHLPQRPGLTWRFITGECHEGWWAKSIGLNIGWHIQETFERQGRADVQYLSHLEGNLPLGKGGSHMRLFHPGGGTAYALSYKAQKIVESYSGGEKPAVLLLGHYHKLAWFYTRNVHVIMAGCAQNQSRWMRAHHIEAHVGYLIVELQLDGAGAVGGCTILPRTFFDRDYHINLGEWEPHISQALDK